MIRFFRSIRQGLVNEGKTSKYLRYAVGEVVLIVVGILIAIQIADWNDARADEERKRIYLERLVVNIESNMSGFEYSMDLSELRLSFLDLLIEAAKDPEIVRGRTAEFLFAVRDAYGTASPPLASDTFEEMVSTGYIRLLDDELYKTLYTYYKRDELLGNNQLAYDADQNRYRELKAGVLSGEQEAWMLAKIPRTFVNHSQEIKNLSYDEGAVVEAAYRLQRKQGLVDWLPQLKHNSTANMSELQGQYDRAEELLAMLKTALEESN